MTEKKQDTQDFTDKIWDFFCSLKLTILLLLLLAITSIIGTVIPQNSAASEYIGRYGQSNYELFVALQFTDMYSSSWFIGLLALFSINLICCSIKHFPRTWKFFKEPTLIATPGLLKNSANKGDFTTSEAPTAVADRVAATLDKEFAKAQRSEQDGKIYLFAQKGIFSRLGAYLTHLSILVIMAGAIIGNLFGFKAFVNIAEGTSVSQVSTRDGSQRIDLGFEVRCDNFDVEFYPDTQRPMLYASDLVVLEDGEEVYEKRISVNHPLMYKGIIFYQSSYGAAGEAYVDIKATSSETGESVNLKAQIGQPIPLMDGYQLIVTGFTENDRNFGPAMRLNLITPAGVRENPVVVWQNFPEFDERRGGSFKFAMAGFNQPYFTGLQVAKDPGVNIVWAGCIMMIIGPFAAFFFSHKRVWVCIEDSGKKTRVQVAANAHRNQGGFALAFDELRAQIETAANNESPKKEG